jgi:hypothetical protein
VVPENIAKQYEEQMAKPDLVFLTKENEQRLKAKAMAAEQLNDNKDSGASADPSIA